MTGLKRVLVVAYYFPPLGGIGSIRVARLAEHLAGHGWEAVVLAPKDLPHQRDAELSFPESRVVRSRSLEPGRVSRGLGKPRPAPGTSAGTPSVVGGRAAALARKAAHRALVYPDAQIGWYPGAVAAGLRALRDQSFDAIYSSSNPITAHLVARTLSRRTGLPWVAEFRDPWAVFRPGRLHRRRAERLERRLAREATGVVMPTPTWAAHFGELWGREIAVVSNGYDVQLDPAPRPSPPVITHLGTYYPERQDFGVLWSAIARLRAEEPAAAPVVRFVGDLPAGAREQLDRAGVADLMEVTGLVPHERAKELVAGSSVLIGVDIKGDGPIALGQVPAKLFEYLASDVPILYVANPGSDASALMDGQPGCYVVPPGDLEAAHRVLREALAAGRFERAPSEFSREAAAGRVRDVLERAVSAPRPGRRSRRART